MTLVDWIGAWPGAVLLQRSGTIYLFVNAAHIASVGLLIGGILPLDLRLVGLLRGVDEQVGRARTLQQDGPRPGAEPLDEGHRRVTQFVLMRSG